MFDFLTPIVAGSGRHPRTLSFLLLSLLVIIILTVLLLISALTFRWPPNVATFLDRLLPSKDMKVQNAGGEKSEVVNNASSVNGRGADISVSSENQSGGVTAGTIGNLSQVEK